MKVKIELEDEQWSWVLDAISDCEGQAHQWAEWWKGGCREQWYKDEESFYSNIHKEISDQLNRELKVEE